MILNDGREMVLVLIWDDGEGEWEWTGVALPPLPNWFRLD